MQNLENANLAGSSPFRNFHITISDNEDNS